MCACIPPAGPPIPLSMHASSPLAILSAELVFHGFENDFRICPIKPFMLGVANYHFYCIPSNINYYRKLDRQLFYTQLIVGIRKSLKSLLKWVPISTSQIRYNCNTKLNVNNYRMKGGGRNIQLLLRLVIKLSKQF